jgi:hypothetical protein
MIASPWLFGSKFAKLKEKRNSLLNLPLPQRKQRNINLAEAFSTQEMRSNNLAHGLWHFNTESFLCTQE